MAGGGLVRGRGTTSTTKTGEGEYQVSFDADVRNCAYFATLGHPETGVPPAGEIAVGPVANNANGVRVLTRDSAGAGMADRSFHLIVSC